jgi:Domain of unknown function (DUF4349)
MPSRPDTAIDERFDELVAQLRAARPEPSSLLRERVLTIAREPAPARRKRLRVTLPSFRPALAVAAAAGVAAVAVGIATQLDGRTTAGGDGAALEAVRSAPGADATLEAGKAADSATPAPPGAARQSAESPPPSGSRLQDYRAELRVHVGSVDDLSRTTSQAMRTARSLGGYVVSARFDAPGDDGDSVLVFRIPVTRVQEAIVRLTSLGGLISQRIELEDLQAPLERQTDAIGELRTRVRSLERTLQNRNLSEEERARLQLELMQTRQQLADQLRQRAETLERGRLALVSLTLTTRDGAEAIPAPPGEAEQRLRDAVSALGEMVTWLLYAAIVASPFLALAAIGVALERRRRRRADDRLLERA